MSIANLKPLIAIEGIDGAGKCTQAVLLTEWLCSNGKPAFKLSFPVYESLSGGVICDYLQEKWTIRSEPENEVNPFLSALLFQCFMTVNRYEYAGLVKNTLSEKSVVCDRYWPSGLAYGKAAGISENFLEAIHSSLPAMQLCIFLDVPVEESVKRRPRRRDKHERDLEYLARVREEYLAFCLKYSWSVVDGLGSEDEVQERIRVLVSKLYLPEELKHEGSN